MHTQETQNLPVELREMVRNAVKLLGQVITRELGSDGFKRIEAVRREMTRLRDLSPQNGLNRIQKVYKELGSLPFKQQRDMAHAFTLMLELMNACENAYRTYLVRNRVASFWSGNISKKPKEPKRVVYVLTAHPTEARSPNNILIFHQIQEVITDAFLNGFDSERSKLLHLLELAWKISLVRKKKPTVLDEAESIYTILLREDVISTLLKASEDLVPVYIRSWVGGDKDGHPGVDEKTFLGSLQMSRKFLIHWVVRHLKELSQTIHILESPALVARLKKSLRAIQSQLSSLKVIQTRDAGRIRTFRNQLNHFQEEYARLVGTSHPTLDRLCRLLQVFPALVVPLELRESSEMIMQKTHSNRLAIVRMLRVLKKISIGGNPKWYARGFIISMTSQFEHIQTAARLVEKTLGDLKIPVIPLFEEPETLQGSGEIVSKMLKNRKIIRALKLYWNSYLEIMVGYSDSAKEGGVLPSRVAIAQAMYRLDKIVRKHSVSPLFFHGSGGSVDRGGGTIRDQIAWWPKSALENYKATLQGEMVERSFASSEITCSQLEHLVRRAEELYSEKRALPGVGIVSDFAQEISKEYKKKVSSPGFLSVVEKATPYPYLSVLKIGSRPSKRSTKPLSIYSLRAIPWVLCWTQTRILFPTWWGVGTVWKKMSPPQKDLLKQAFQKDPLFRSFVKALGFTLAKIEPQIWKMYLEKSPLDPKVVRSIENEFQEELQYAIHFVTHMSESENLLWYRPWLATSIYLRSTMIHPLNLLQILAFERKDFELIRLTVTGISSGMMTTG